jgi:UDP-3-O-[3-hydroxymyristoyl] glucosamine N-acyltransferase
MAAAALKPLWLRLLREEIVVEHGASTVIGPGAVVRAGAIIYAGTEIGENTVVGHHTLLRSFVTVGSETQLGHNLTIERATRIGDLVRCSPGSHITSSCSLADRVFLGAGVRTVNDKEMTCVTQTDASPT